MGLHKPGQQRSLSASGLSAELLEGPSRPTLLLLTKPVQIAMLRISGDLPRGEAPSFLESAVPTSVAEKMFPALITGYLNSGPSCSREQGCPRSRQSSAGLSLPFR